MLAYLLRPRMRLVCCGEKLEKKRSCFGSLSFDECCCSEDDEQDAEADVCAVVIRYPRRDEVERGQEADDGQADIHLVFPVILEPIDEQYSCAEESECPSEDG